MDSTGNIDFISPPYRQPFPTHLTLIPKRQKSNEPPAPKQLRSSFEFQHLGSSVSFPATIENLFADKKNLYIIIKAQFDPNLTSDWIAVELSDTQIAPMFLDGRYKWLNQSTVGITRWRFIITRKGNALVEKQTDEGRSIDNQITWQHQLNISEEKKHSFYTSTFIIPRALFPEMQSAKSTFRMNLLRHYQQADRAPVTKRWWPDAGDVFLMPKVEIESTE